MNLYSALKNISISKAFSFVAHLISATIIFRYFGAELRGEIAIIIAIVGIAQISIIEIGQAIQVFIIEYKTEPETPSLYTLLWSGLLIRIIWASIIMFMLYFLSDILSSNYEIMSLDKTLKLCSIVLICFILRGPIDSNFLIAVKQYKELRNIEILESSFYLIVSITTVLFKQNILYYVFFILVSKHLVFPYTWYLYAKTLKKYKNPFFIKSYISFPLIKKILNYSTPIWMSGLMYTASPSITIMILGKLFSNSVVGNYSLAVGIYSMIYSLISLPEGLILPKLKEQISVKRKNNYEVANYGITYWKFYFLLSTVCSVLIYIFSNILIEIIGGNEYSIARNILPLFCLVFIARSLSIFRNFIYVKGDTSIIPRIYLIRLFVEYLSYPFTIKLFGILGIPVSIFIGYLIYGLYLLKNIIFDFEYGEIIKNKKEYIVGKTLIVSILLTLLIVFEHPIYSPFFGLITLIGYMFYEIKSNDIINKTKFLLLS